MLHRHREMPRLSSLQQYKLAWDYLPCLDLDEDIVLSKLWERNGNDAELLWLGVSALNSQSCCTAKVVELQEAG